MALKSRLINVAGSNKSQLIAKFESLVKLVIKIKQLEVLILVEK